MPFNEHVANDLLAQVRVWLLAVLHEVRLSKQLLAAIEQNDAASVSACLGEGADPNAYVVPYYCAPALLRAVTQYYDPNNPPDDRWDLWDDDESPVDEPHFGRMSINNVILEALLDAGADVDKRDKCNSTALEVAIRFCDRSVLQILLARGADVKSPLPDHQTVLQIAVFNRDADTVRILLQSGADVNARYFNGETALLTAVRLVSEERQSAHTNSIVEALLDSGADVTIADNSGRKAMDYLPRGLLGILLSSHAQRQLLRTFDFRRRGQR